MQASAGSARLMVHAVADMGMLELNEENVEMVLDEVRPYLMAGEFLVRQIISCHCRWLITLF